MKQKTILLLAGVVLLLVLSNVLPVKSIVGTDNCSYSNGNGDFTFREENFFERNFRMCQNRFREFKKTGGQDTVLYRLCPRNPLYFWNWGDYILSERYKLPYRRWEDISVSRKRGKGRTIFQDF